MEQMGQWWGKPILPHRRQRVGQWGNPLIGVPHNLPQGCPMRIRRRGATPVGRLPHAQPI